MNKITIFINSPLEQFEVSSLLSLNAPILGYLNISLTNLALYSIIVLSLIISIKILYNKKSYKKIYLF